MNKSRLADLDRSVEGEQEWILPENLKARAAAGKGALGLFKAFAEGTDTESALPHAILDAEYAELYVRNLTGQLQNSGFDLSGNILDAGCALGMISEGFRKVMGQSSTIHGIDVSPEVIENARKLHPHCRFEAHSADDLSIYPDHYFNLVHLREFYPFTRSARVGFHIRFLEAMLPKLRPGGLVAAIQIVDKKGLADTFDQLQDLCAELGYQRVFRKVVVPLRLFRRWGGIVHRPPGYWAVSLAGHCLESILSSKVSFIYGFQKARSE